MTPGLTDIRANYDGFPPTLGDLSEQQFQNSNDLPNINRRELTTKTNTYRDNWNAIDKGGQHFADVRLKLEYFQTPSRHGGRTAGDAILQRRFLRVESRYQEPRGLRARKRGRNTQMALFGIGSRLPGCDRLALDHGPDPQS